MIPLSHSLLRPWLARLLVLAPLCQWALAAEEAGVAQFRKDIQPILTEYCYDCHGDGAKKGGVAFDELKSNDALFDHQLWIKVMKNLRADLMPPQKKPRPNAEARKRVEDWIKYTAFGIDPKNPDPGRVTVRRLNRVEYRNTIRDLMGVDFNADVEFPPDDTGYGFDNIGDVLTVSPMLLEKYLVAARAIVSEAVPTVSRVAPEFVIAGNRFHAENNGEGDNQRKRNREAMLSLPYDQHAAVSTSFDLKNAGSYRLSLELAVKGTFDFDPRKCRVVLRLDGRELLQKEFGWYDNKTFPFEFAEKLPAGDHRLDFELTPLNPNVEADETNTLSMRVVGATIRGPMEAQFWTRPKNYDRFFTRETVPEDPAGRREYAGEVFASFTRKAYRRPVDAETVDRLVKLAEGVYSQPNKSFEAGVAHAMMAVLASPRFLFRIEESESTSAQGAYALVDEYSLGARLSYFLWSSMPDEELSQLASRGELRKNLSAQVKRMLADSKSEALIQNFTGQWLQVRDVEGISIDARVVLTRDAGQEKQMKQFREAFLARQAARKATESGQTNALSGEAAFTNILAAMAAQTNDPAAVTLATNALAEVGRRKPTAGFRFNRPRIELDRDLRVAMQRETQMYFGGIVRDDRSVTELVESDYTFLNEKLAGLYGLTNLNVIGPEMRRVTLPPDSPRGGVLTHGSVLVVTSNPDRTSPVKRGLFVLDNILGTPPPPPPPNIPALEATEKDITDHEPLLRESLELHRNSPLCSSCHSRLDPIGLAFENFNAMGMWRDKERNQTIETGGKMVTGETFNSVRELKHLLAHERRTEFYQCLTEKLLTYALGRGTEYYDMETVDQIVGRLEQQNGRFSALLMGIIESAPFQKQRTQSTATTGEYDAPARQPGERKEIAKNQIKP